VRFGRVPKNEKDRISNAMAAAKSQNRNMDGTAQSYKDHISIHHKEYSLVIEGLVREIIHQADDQARHLNLNGENWVSCLLSVIRKSFHFFHETPFSLSFP